jgi:hypothetical protein
MVPIRDEVDPVTKVPDIAEALSPSASPRG